MDVINGWPLIINPSNNWFVLLTLLGNVTIETDHHNNSNAVTDAQLVPVETNGQHWNLKMNTSSQVVLPQDWYCVPTLTFHHN